MIDGPVTTRQSTVWVIVHIEDQNDNPPTFPEVTYRISLPERDRNKRGEPVYRVFAYDRDLGPNGNITYSIVDGNDDDKFGIDPRTAMVSSKKVVTAGSYDILTVSSNMVMNGPVLLSRFTQKLLNVLPQKRPQTCNHQHCVAEVIWIQSGINSSHASSTV